ncbi:MAG TPA: YceI family protein, partial [Chitinophagaceae bacterium]|nr:YceI family protein [Chitinophagaceae bacterium]
MKKMIVIFVALLCSAAARTQDLFITRHGQVSFFSRTPMENIDALNNEVSSVFNSKTGELAFVLLVKGFHFERALMEEHFNENYMESDKIPKASFKGKINNLPAVDLSKDGNYPVTAEGELTIHGVTKQVRVAGNLLVKAGLPQLQAKFMVAPKDYNIKIPSLV